MVIICLTLIPAALHAAAGLPVIKSVHLFDLKADFNCPSDVTVAPNGTIFVLDGINGAVKAFSSEGSYLFSSGTPGNAPAQLKKPLGLDCAADGRIYIADTGNRRVQIMSPDGRFSDSFPVGSCAGTESPDPVDVVIDEKHNRCYVVDNENHGIAAYSLKTGERESCFGGRGEKPGKFQYPFLAALDRRSFLYVVDVLNTRVQVVNPEGRTMAFVGRWGVDRGRLFRPKGVCIDPDQRIYISDSYLGVIQVFERYKKFLGVIGTDSGETIRFTTPVGIHVDNNMRLYVVEMKKNRVSVYDISR
jgi:DNA-binding beta-propeller fold protein YncE